MATAVDICNIGQDLLGAEALASIDAPRSANEKRYARSYPIYLDSELRKRRWLFAKEFAVITPTGDPIETDTKRLYRYEFPAGALRVLRESGSEWVVSGRQLLSETNGEIRVWYIARKLEGFFDPNFCVMLGAKLAEVLCEAVTQSNEKKADAKERYQQAMRDAAMSNAFEIGPQNIADDDSKFSWVQSRYA